MIADSKRKSITKKLSNKKDDKVLQVKTERESSNVSVITKTTTPKVVIQSENVNNNNLLNEINDKHLLLKLICFVIMCIILLMTFFLSLRTYNAVNELSDYVHWRIQP